MPRRAITKLSYDGLAERLKEHGLSETRNPIAAKLKRGTSPATSLIAVIAAIGREVAGPPGD